MLNLLVTSLLFSILTLGISSCKTNASFYDKSKHRKSPPTDNDDPKTDDSNPEPEPEPEPEPDDKEGDDETVGDDKPKTGITADPIPPVSIVDIKARCTASANKIHKQIVSFPKPVETCKWSENGNGPIKDRIVRARFQQNVNLEIPNNALLCGMSFKFEEQEMKYDDEIFLIYNNVILMMSTDYSDSGRYSDVLKADGNGFIEYKWEKLKEAYYGHNAAPDYCLGKGTPEYKCSIPPTETSGKIELGFSKDLVMKLGAATSKIKFDQFSSNTNSDVNPKENTLSFVTTGDNDKTDCIHSNFTFNIEVEYVD